MSITPIDVVVINESIPTAIEEMLKISADVVLAEIGIEYDGARLV